LLHGPARFSSYPGGEGVKKAPVCFLHSFCFVIIRKLNSPSIASTGFFQADGYALLACSLVVISSNIKATLVPAEGENGLAGTPQICWLERTRSPI